MHLSGIVDSVFYGEALSIGDDGVEMYSITLEVVGLEGGKHFFTFSSDKPIIKTQYPTEAAKDRSIVLRRNLREG